MKIPLIQYCIMKNAIKCFKYLLVNGYDDPNQIMKPETLYYIWIDFDESLEIKQYEWDCMATAIFFGNKEIMKILEDKGIQKNNFTYIECL